MNCEFLSRMEEVLAFSALPAAPECPRLCFDETSKQLVKEVRPPLPMRLGHPQRYDYEDQRNGVVNLFLAYDMDAGQRHVTVTETRTRVDFAHQMKALLTGPYRDKKKVWVVLDNLNTHSPASFYEAFPAEEARELVERVEFLSTPKHAGTLWVWLNQAEIELSVLQGQCLNRKRGEKEMLKREVAAWQEPRNRAGTKIKWCFRGEDACMKLKRLSHIWSSSRQNEFSS
mgnify:CR=1 FL=1